MTRPILIFLIMIVGNSYGQNHFSASIGLGYSRQNYIDTGLEWEHKHFAKSRQGFILPLSISYYLNKNIVFGTGVSILGNNHRVDSVNITCGQNSCARGYVLNRWRGYSIPLVVGYYKKLNNSSSVLEFRFGAELSHFLTRSYKRVIYLNEIVESSAPIYFYSNQPIFNYKAKVVFNKAMKSNKVMGIYVEFIRPFTGLSIYHQSYSSLNIGVNFEFWNKEK